MIQILEKTRNIDIDVNLSAILKSVLKEDIGFLNILNNEVWVKDVEKRAQEIRFFPHFAVVGIGGSSLGLKTIIQAFDLNQRVTFFETLDSFSFQKKLSKLNLQNTHVIVISKSGNTVETLESLKLIEKEYQKSNLNFSKHFTCITEKKKNPLFDFATVNNIPMLEIPLDLGGRYSVLSPVGMLLSEALGLKTKDFLTGAKSALTKEDVILTLVAQSLESFKNNEWITNMWVYSERLSYFGAWFEQLWAESLAKKKTLDGKTAPRISTPNTLLGSQDQHSLLQQIMEGYRDKFTIFLRCKEEESTLPEIGAVYKAQVLGVQKALKEVGASSLQIYLEKLTEKELGALFMIWQLVIVVIARSFNINPFDQPGVERSKVLTKELLCV